MQKEKSSDFSETSCNGRETFNDDYVCSGCFSCGDQNMKCEMKKMSNKMEKLVDTVNLLVQQNVLLQQHLIDGKEKGNVAEVNSKPLQQSKDKNKIEEKFTDLEKKFGDLFNNLSIHSLKTNFVKVENKWDRTNGKCCDDKCILLNPDGNCKKGNGIVKFCGGKVDYLKGENYNQPIKVFAKNAFKKSGDFSNSSSSVGKTLLFYFEVTVIRNERLFSIGLRTNKCEYFVNSFGNYWNGSDWEKIFPRNFKNGDVGCGLILPSTIFSDNNRTNLFFTLNGEKFDDYCVLEKENTNADFLPFVGLCECSVEANFGEKEFEYKIEEEAI